MTAQAPSDRAGNVEQFKIIGNKGNTIDLKAVEVEISYYENVLSSTASAVIVLTETGMTDQLGAKGVLDELPIRGGEQVELIIEDAQDQPTKLSFTGDDKSLYVNRVKDIDPDTQKDVYLLDLCPKEVFTNEQTRVLKIYDGKVSDNVRKILKEPLGGKEKDDHGLMTKKEVTVDDTIVPFNFIGNTKKPFWVCTWLASKGVPDTGKGGAAGYLFYETYDGFNFRAIDKLLEQKAKKNFVMTGTVDLPDGYDGKIDSISIKRVSDLHQNLLLGTYANRSLILDYYAFDYRRRNYNIREDQKDKVKNAGKQDLTWVAEDFSQGPSRIFTFVEDMGTLPSPKDDPKEQLKTWKNKPKEPTFDWRNTSVQSIMRYNQLFTVTTDVMIKGDFSLRAGDMIQIDIAEISVDEKTKPPNRELSGIYMIASLCHRMTTEEVWTSLTLVRDTFGRKPITGTEVA